MVTSWWAYGETGGSTCPDVGYEMVRSPWKTVWLFLKGFNRVPMGSSNSTPGCRPKRNGTIWSSKHLCANVHSSIIHHGQAMDTAQMSMNRWEDVEVQCIRAMARLPIQRRPWHVLQHENIMLVTEASHKSPHVVGFPLYAVLEEVNLRCLPQAGLGMARAHWEETSDCRCVQDFFLGWWKFPKIDNADGSQLGNMLKAPELYTLNEFTL